MITEGKPRKSIDPIFYHYYLPDQVFDSTISEPDTTARKPRSSFWYILIWLQRDCFKLFIIADNSVLITIIVILFRSKTTVALCTRVRKRLCADIWCKKWGDQMIILLGLYIHHRNQDITLSRHFLAFLTAMKTGSRLFILN
jgi:hypothetical protein